MLEHYHRLILSGGLVCLYPSDFKSLSDGVSVKVVETKNEAGRYNLPAFGFVI